MQDNHFLDMIAKLRQDEEIMLYGNLLYVNEESASEVQEFLQTAYRQEILNYPGQAPTFDPVAGLWAAKTVYVAAQLMLYREHKEEDLEALLPAYKGISSPSAILSADLCLRFVPGMLKQLKLIDPEDPLLEILEKLLHQWHYSGVRYPLSVESLDLSKISLDPCLFQLYCNRIIKYRNIKLALNSTFQERVKANLGIYAAQFWNEFNLENYEHTHE